MTERRKLKTSPDKPVRRSVSRPKDDEVEVSDPASSYFASGDQKDLDFISSGCKVFDEALGGGWVLGRIANIVGDKSSGKTLLAIEACANFNRKYPNDRIRYCEAEAAFDESYAEALGMPLSAVDFAPSGKIDTVEAFYADLLAYLDRLKGRPGLYILDSLDALSDDAEKGREIGEASFGGSKPKKMNETFRRLVSRIEREKVLLIVISQLKDKIGVTFGETKTRSGGKALDYYSTHIVWLAQTGRLDKTIEGVKRIYGIDVRASVKKNKVGLPFREASFPILFGYGVDDLTAGVEWLIEVKRQHLLEELGVTQAGYKVRLTNLRNKGGAPVVEFRDKMNSIISKEWGKIETAFLPKSKKY